MDIIDTTITTAPDVAMIIVFMTHTNVFCFLFIIALLKHHTHQPRFSRHVSLAFKMLLNEPGCRVLENLSAVEMKQLRSAMISLIRSTDMAHHMSLLLQFKSRSSGTRPFQKDSFDDRVQIMQMALKCADINHPSKPWVSRRCECLCSEDPGHHWTCGLILIVSVSFSFVSRICIFTGASVSTRNSLHKAILSVREAWR